MANTLSDYFTDEGFISNLRALFEDDERYNLDLMSIINQVEDYDKDFLLLTFRGRKFLIDRLTGAIMEK